jgi:hypothetical protein
MIGNDRIRQDRIRKGVAAARTAIASEEREAAVQPHEIMIQVVIFVELLPRIAGEIGKGEKIPATFSVDQSIPRQEDGRTSLQRASL